MLLKNTKFRNGDPRLDFLTQFGVPHLNFSSFVGIEGLILLRGEAMAASLGRYGIGALTVAGLVVAITSFLRFESDRSGVI